MRAFAIALLALSAALVGVSRHVHRPHLTRPPTLTHGEVVEV